VAELPTGTVTFLFTDLEGSTRLWEQHPEAMRAALARHDAIVVEAVEAHRGEVVKSTGDGTHAVFVRAEDAVSAAAAAQAALAAEPWGVTGPLRVRMGLHTGSAELRGGDYYGAALNRAARLMGIGHGGQVLVSHVTAELVGDALEGGVGLVDLGEHRLRDLSRPERVFQLTAPGLDDLFPPLRSMDVLSTNLPVQLTSFVGRTDEVKSIEELLGSHRIVTLTGVGGVGKTRLAVQVAAQLLDRYRDGVWLVELATVEAPRLLAVTAGVLGVNVPAGQTIEAALLEHLRSCELLVVLDNAEHLIREARRVAELIVHDTAGVSLLVTSREGLRVTGEQLFSVPSLEDDAAIRLFVERAGAVDSSFELNDTELETVAALCARLDGIPLAIELAAARVSMFNIAELATRVEQRFRLLTGGRGGIERHQTLRAAIDWSYDLLTAQERLVLARFSVFAGGCTLEAAEAVLAGGDVAGDDVVDLLSGLIDKSLISVDRTHAATRYLMSETVRQYAEERLLDSGDAETIRTRHTRWYADFARAAGRGLYSADEANWLERLAGEMNNLQVAVSWAVASDDTEAAMRLGGSFPRQGQARPLLGTVYLAEEALRARGADEHPLRARVMAEAGWAAIVRGDDTKATALLDQSIDAQYQGARYAVASFIYAMTYIGWTSGRFEDAYDIVKRGLVMAEATGDVQAALGLRITMSTHAMLNERETEAQELARAALTEARTLGVPTFETAAIYANAMALSRTDPQRAMTLLQESIELAGQFEIDSERLAALGLLASLEALYGDARRSLEALRQVLLSTSAPQLSYIFLQHGIPVFNRAGRPDLVARCHGHTRNTRGYSHPFYLKLNEGMLKAARAAVGDQTYDRLVEEGSTTPPEIFNRMIVREIDPLLAGIQSTS
jgi:predicted ATPase/class 3 adenylate cyclase